MSFVIQHENFTPAPAGYHSAVCVDLIDLGYEPSPWGELHKCRIIWEINKPMEDGRPFLVYGKYTVSLDPKSNLHQLLKGWRGREFTEDELRAFDLEKIVGTSCYLLVEHASKDGKTYANVKAASHAKTPQERLQPSGQYIRKAPRERHGQAPQRFNTGNQSAHSNFRPAQQSPARPTQPPPAEDDNIPF